MQQETLNGRAHRAIAKKCQNCKERFTIEPEDFAFYEKMEVPAPTWCPECRLIRRMLWRNERFLYKRKCDLCKEDIIAVYRPDSPLKVYCNKCWWSDNNDMSLYGRDYDFSIPFFENIARLQKEVPVPALDVEATTMVNSEYNNDAGWLKNCYYVIMADYDEDCYYSYYIFRSKNCVDCSYLMSSELCADCVHIYKGYNSVGLFNCEGDEIDCFFSKNCRNVNNCFGCVNLRHKSYHIFNEPYNKEEYEKKMKEFDLGSWENYQKYKQIAEELWAKYPIRFRNDDHVVNSTGDYIYETKNCKDCFEVYGAEDCRYLAFFPTPMSKDCMDCTVGGDNASRLYETTVCGLGTSDIKFSFQGYRDSLYQQYCVTCISSSNLFGCIGLRKKQYCILNKQYTKEEYERLVLKIIDHMNEMPYTDKKGRVYRFGEFFPFELSPFAYNETLTQEYFPLNEAEAKSKGFQWQKPTKRNYKITIQAKDLPDHIKDVDDSIINEIIGCEHEGKCNEQCTTAFKIIKQELEFYRKMNLPLPRLCPNCRYYQRGKWRTPLKLWRRKCQCAGEKSDNGVYKNTGLSHPSHKDGEHCPNEFETAYPPEREEIIYCVKCQNNEMV